MKKRRWIAWALLIAAAAAVCAFFALRGAEKTTYTQEEVTRGELTVYYNFDGQVNAPRAQTVTAQEGGTVKTVYAAQNARVKKGERICRLEGGQTVEAGMDGELTSLAVEEGSVVSAGETIARIVDMDRLNVVIDIDEYDIAAAQIGAPVELRVLSSDQTAAGHIAAIDRDGTLSGDLTYYKATVELEGGAQGLYPGMQVSAKILRAQATDAALLHADAIQFDAQNQPYVLMAGEGKGETVAVPVSVGLSDGTLCQILSGVEAGDVVLRPASQTFPLMALHMGQ